MIKRDVKPEAAPTITGQNAPADPVVATLDIGLCIRRSGLIQAAAQSPGIAAYSTTFEDFLTKCEEAAERFQKFVEKQ